MRREEAIEALNEWKKNPKNIRFESLIKVVEAFGFHFSRGKGSHHIYTREDVTEILNFQEVDGKAKPCQIRQFIAIVEKYNLQVAEDNADL
jgi:hypothetical protein